MVLLSYRAGAEISDQSDRQRHKRSKDTSIFLSSILSPRPPLTDSPLCILTLHSCSLTATHKAAIDPYLFPLTLSLWISSCHQSFLSRPLISSITCENRAFSFTSPPTARSSRPIGSMYVLTYNISSQKPLPNISVRIQNLDVDSQEAHSRRRCARAPWQGRPLCRPRSGLCRGPARPRPCRRAEHARHAASALCAAHAPFCAAD